MEAIDEKECEVMQFCSIRSHAPLKSCPTGTITCYSFRTVNEKNGGEQAQLDVN